MFKKLITIILAGVMILSLAACGNTSDNKTTITNGNNNTNRNDYVNNITPPQNNQEINNVITEIPDTEGIYYADIVVRDYGTISLELDADTAPITVKNFIDLANNGFYNGLTFHRIMDGFMIQGGDPMGNGMGGSDMNIKGEFSANGVENNISHVRGVISMARQGENPYTGEKNHDTASSQFFIVHQDSQFLDGQYAAFGRVTSGMEVVDAICESARPIDNNGTISATQQPIIESITIKNN